MHLLQLFDMLPEFRHHRAVLLVLAEVRILQPPE